MKDSRLDVGVAELWELWCTSFVIAALVFLLVQNSLQTIRIIE